MTAPARILSFGCRLNAYESEAMRTALGEAPDTVVVNTCAVTAEAVRQAEQAIRKARRETPGARILVTGCAAQIEPERFARMAEVDRVLGNREKLDHTHLHAQERVAVGDIMTARTAEAPIIDGLAERARAVVQVQNGCDHRCTFCVIPYGRGPSRSVPADIVVAQIARLVDNGYREVVLTGVDLTAYGADLPETPTLGDLVADILKRVRALPRLRLSSIDSVEADPLLIELISHEPRVMPHLHLSLQAGDDMILKRMKRRHSRAQAVEFCATLRAARPEIAFGADLIAGFPTESEAMFDGTLALIDDCGLSYAHVFPFSARPGTPAARMPALDGRIVRARAKRLRDKAQAAHAAHLDAQRGRIVSVLAEEPQVGRSEDFTLVDLDRASMPGQLLRARVTGADGRRLAATVLS